jgi:2-C-methyl-D-erythritol 2,4-cyclodiphosphate synthase
VGIGYDIHPLVAGKRLVLGGVEIPHTHGLEGHSDADVLLHAVIDALLGAAALEDIGAHFPSRDPQYRGISSLVLLERTAALLAHAGLRVSNLDATILAERPPLSPFRDRMAHNVAEALGIEVGRVNIKAKTADGLGPVGRGEGMAAQAIAALEEA